MQLLRSFCLRIYLILYSLLLYSPIFIFENSQMISNFLKKLPFLNRAGLKESVLATLEKGGYSVDGAIFFRNYHQVYCGVKAPDGKTIGSAWQFSLKKDELLLIGGYDAELLYPDY